MINRGSVSKLQWSKYPVKRNKYQKKGKADKKISEVDDDMADWKNNAWKIDLRNHWRIINEALARINQRTCK